MDKWTPEADSRLREYLARDGYVIPAGLGTKDAPCSIGAINWVATGNHRGDYTHFIPEFMSKVVGRWIITVQDEMSEEMRNSDEWKALLPLAAATGADKETDRLLILSDWMWDRVLPYLQPVADAQGFGNEWRGMCVLRSFVENAGVVDAARRAGNLPAMVTAERIGWGYSFFEEVPELGADDIAVIAKRVARASLSPCLAPHDVLTLAWEHFDPVGVLSDLVAVS